MFDYLSSSALYGRRPKKTGISRLHSRPELLSKMIRERRKPRFLIAPPRFGKTALALEYAESVFGCKDVFWLDGASPCFLRDLDNEHIAYGLTDLQKKPGLIVLEDVPALDEARTGLFVSAVERLMDGQFEVVVTSTPACDSVSARFEDKLVLGARDLLLADSDIDSERSEAERRSRPAASFTVAERIPGLFWGGGPAVRGLLDSFLADGEDPPFCLALFVMVVLQDGSLKDLGAFVRKLDPGFQARLTEQYLYLGVNPYTEDFEVHPMDVADIAQAFSHCLGDLVASSYFASKDALVSRLADALIGKDRPERACMLVQTLCTVSQRVSWMGSRDFVLLERNCLLPAHQVYASFRLPNTLAGKLAQAAEAWRLYILGAKEPALAQAAKVVASKRVSEKARGIAALLLARYGNGPEQDKGAHVLREELAWEPVSPEAWFESRVREADPCRFSWDLAAAGLLYLRSSPQDALEFLEHAYRIAQGDHAVAALHFWMAEDMLATAIRADSKGEVRRHEALMVKACDAIEAKSRLFAPGLLDALLLDAFERLVSSRLVSTEIFITPDLKSSIGEIELALFTQRNMFSKVMQQEENRDARRRRRVPDRQEDLPSLVVPYEATKAPPLHIELFGGLSVRMGEKPLPASAFARQSVKLLLAMLVINQGKELSREHLATLMWPESKAETARKNLYSTWSLLKKALSLPPGGCPYLATTQGCCKLNAHMVSSDIAQFDVICKSLLFDEPDALEWSKAYAQLTDLYRGDILPSEIRNEHLIQIRRRYRNRFIEVFAVAAKRLLDIGECQSALWFARAVIDQDKTREDAYETLMRAQIGLGQRTSAIETYFMCRRHLVNELGIDPSTRTAGLYQEVIDEEPGLEAYGEREA